MWISEDTESLPFFVTFGSTNYGQRSVHKDVEAEVIVVTRNDLLQRRIRHELQSLRESSAVVSDVNFTNGAQGRLQPVVSLVAQLGQDYM
jgi:CDP-diacylglycerol--glycerol-3-phosphate 3-phosphatidyltransferase